MSLKAGLGVDGFGLAPRRGRAVALVAFVASKRDHSAAYDRCHMRESQVQLDLRFGTAFE
jgi:hypothetical protein